MTGTFKCGIEIHQRLATKHKLFCNCSANMPEEKKTIEIVRILHPVASELGEVDVAAQFEKTRARQFKYQLKPSSTCLVELDSEPPLPINKEALDTTIELCMLLNARIVDELQIMRKTVIDGSNTGGFQRTIIVGLNGSLATSKGSVSIPTICLEEESAGIIEKKEKETVYSLDRLGIPLIEIATGTDIVDPEHAKEVAERLGTLLRITGKVQRGIGTIRQDVNISIPEGARIEIKGVQELADIPLIVENETKRQKELINVREELKKRQITDAMPSILDLNDIFASSSSEFLKKQKGKVFGVKFKGMQGIFGIQLTEKIRFGTELSGYAKIAAGIGGIIHGDENLKEKYGFSDDEITKVKMRLNLETADGFVLVVTDKLETASNVIRAISSRIKQALVGVPEETRNALTEGETAYMRPLPGGARLYPETDTPPFVITKEHLARIKAELPKSPEELKKDLVALIGNEQLADSIMLSPRFSTFQKAVKGGVDAKFVASTFMNTFVSLKREGLEVDNISDAQLTELFAFVKDGKITKTVVPDLLKEIVSQKSVEYVVKAKKWYKLSVDVLKEMVKKEVRSGEDVRDVFKRLMAKYRLVVDAGELQRELDSYLKK